MTAIGMNTIINIIILFEMENFSLEATFVMYKNRTNIPPTITKKST